MSDKQHRKEVMASLRSLKAEELASQGKELTEEAFWLQWKHKSGQVENTASLRGARKKLARVRTLLREKELAQLDQEQKS